MHLFKDDHELTLNVEVQGTPIILEAKIVTMEPTIACIKLKMDAGGYRVLNHPHQSIPTIFIDKKLEACEEPEDPSTFTEVSFPEFNATWTTFSAEASGLYINITLMKNKQDRIFSLRPMPYHIKNALDRIESYCGDHTSVNTCKNYIKGEIRDLRLTYLEV